MSRAAPSQSPPAASTRLGLGAGGARVIVVRPSLAGRSISGPTRADGGQPIQGARIPGRREDVALGMKMTKVNRCEFHAKIHKQMGRCFHATTPRSSLEPPGFLRSCRVCLFVSRPVGAGSSVCSCAASLLYRFGTRAPNGQIN